MKTAKEITEYLENEFNHNEKMFIHLVHIQHPEGYDSKIKTLEKLRKYFLRWEYVQNTQSDMKGIEDALRWVLDDSGGPKP